MAGKERKGSDGEWCTLRFPARCSKINPIRKYTDSRTGATREFQNMTFYIPEGVKVGGQDLGAEGYYLEHNRKGCREDRYRLGAWYFNVKRKDIFPYVNLYRVERATDPETGQVKVVNWKADKIAVDPKSLSMALDRYRKRHSTEVTLPASRTEPVLGEDGKREKTIVYGPDSTVTGKATGRDITMSLRRAHIDASYGSTGQERDVPTFRFEAYSNDEIPFMFTDGTLVNGQERVIVPVSALITAYRDDIEAEKEKARERGNGAAAQTRVREEPARGARASEREPDPNIPPWVEQEGFETLHIPTAAEIDAAGYGRQQALPLDFGAPAPGRGR